MSNEKIGIFILSLVLALLLSACAEDSEGETLHNISSDDTTESMVITEETGLAEIEEISENRVLIVYFGRWGNYVIPFCSNSYIRIALVFHTGLRISEFVGLTVSEIWKIEESILTTSYSEKGIWNIS